MGWRRGAMIVWLVCCLVGAALIPAQASAARYHAYSCHTPYGEVAPTEGWTGSTSGSYAYAIDDCRGTTTYALTAALDGQVTHPADVSNALWTFTAGQDLSLAGATLFRHEGLAGGSGPAAAYLTYFAAPTVAYDAADVIENCQANLGCSARGTNQGGFDPSNRLVAAAAKVDGASNLFMEAACGGIAGQTCPTSPGYAAEADLYAADLTLDDKIAPVAASLGGGLIAGGTLTGPAEVWFRAYDQGSGVYDGQLVVDGQPVTSQVIDDNAGRCKTVGEATDGLRDFRYPVPCKSGVSADLTLDTGRIRDGRHTLQVTVDDAAGNVTSVYSATIVTRNAPQGGQAQVSGILAQGQQLVADPGTWYPAPTAFAYQWLRCATPTTCEPITNAVGQTYRLAAADAYQRMAVEVTASDAAGSTTVRSAPIGPIADLSGSATGGVGSVAAQGGGLAGAHGPPGAPAGAGAGAGHGPNGIGACAAARLTAAFASGAHVRLPGAAALRGALDCAGHPIGGAAIAVTVARRGDGGTPAAATVRTSKDGTFALAVGPGPSRELTLSYRASVDASAPAVTTTVRLEVTPSIGLSIRPVRARNGQTITYSGRVFGGYIPPSGLSLDVQYRDGRRWRTFDQTRARARDGRFVYRYTFRRTTLPIVYTFRVLIPPTGAGDYPYASTGSRPRSVRVDP